MECRNDLCVYYSYNSCLLDEIEVNEVGMCASRINVAFTEEELSKKREEALERFEREADW